MSEKLRRTIITLTETPDGGLSVAIEFKPLINPQAEPTLSMKAAFSMLDSLKDKFDFPQRVVTEESEGEPERN